MVVLGGSLMFFRLITALPKSSHSWMEEKRSIGVVRKKCGGSGAFEERGLGDDDVGNLGFVFFCLPRQSEKRFPTIFSIS